MQLTRRTVQIIVLLWIILIPLLSLYGIHLYSVESFSLSLASQNISPPGKTESIFFRAFDATIGKLENPRKFIDKFKGSPWSFTINGFNVTEPLGVLITVTSGSAFYKPFLWSLIGFGAVSVILGRVFCGWICPAHLLLELTDKLRRLFEKLSVVKLDVEFKRTHKYTLLGGLFLLSILSGTHMIIYLHPPMVLSRELFYAVYFNYMGSGIYLLLFIIAFELAISRRWWCRYLCPGGALYSLMGSRRALRLERVKGLCTDCVECDVACPFGLSPMTDRMGMECDNCGLCRSSCPENALIYRWTFFGRAGRNGEEWIKEEGISSKYSAAQR